MIYHTCLPYISPLLPYIRHVLPFISPVLPYIRHMLPYILGLCYHISYLCYHVTGRPCRFPILRRWPASDTTLIGLCSAPLKLEDALKIRSGTKLNGCYVVLPVKTLNERGLLTISNFLVAVITQFLSCRPFRQAVRSFQYVSGTLLWLFFTSLSCFLMMYSY